MKCRSWLISILQVLMVIIVWPILGDGFRAGTLIKTPSGHQLVELLKEGDVVVSYDFSSQVIAEDKIIKIGKHTSNNNVKIVANGAEIIMHQNQRLYVDSGSKMLWTGASKLKSTEQLVDVQLRSISIETIEISNQATDLYVLSTQEHHNFFVGEADFLAHNIAFVLGAVWGFEIVVDIAVPVFMAAGSWVYGNFFGSSNSSKLGIKRPNDNDWNHFLNNKLHDHGFNEKDPNKIWPTAEKALLAAIADDKIKEGSKYAVNAMTEYGLLEITGKVVNGIVRIGTMYIKKG